jgi:predicted DNA-binding transcriptional regulator AlpA
MCPDTLLIFGKPYCKNHYLLGLEKAFLCELSPENVKNRSHKLINLFGRYLECLYDEKGTPMPEALGVAKLRDRAKSLHLDGHDLTFIIDRHLMPIPSRQQWKFDLVTKILTLESEEPIYLGVDEAADKLGISNSAVYGRIKRGQLKAIKVSEVPEILTWVADRFEKGRSVRGTYGGLSRNKWLISTDELKAPLKRK